MKSKEYKNLDILRNKRMNTEWVSEIIGCSPSTVRAWVKKGMFSKQDYVSYGFNACPTKSNTYSIIKVLEWLKDNNKNKYANILEEYLSRPYECESCCTNNAVLTHRSKYGGGGYYICYDCYMNRISKEELGVYEKDGLLRSKNMYCIVKEDWDIYNYALEYAKYINKNLEMIIDKKEKDIIFVFK